MTDPGHEHHNGHGHPDCLACQMGPEFAMDKLDHDIRTAGWAVIAIPDAHPVFAYTVGLTEMFETARPELLVTGLPADVAGSTLAAAVAAMQDDNAVFEANTYDDRVLVGLRVAFMEADAHNEDLWLGVAIERYGHDVSALHLIWPDPNDRFPWDEGFQRKYRDAQPLNGTWVEPS